MFRGNEMIALSATNFVHLFKTIFGLNEEGSGGGEVFGREKEN